MNSKLLNKNPFLQNPEKKNINSFDGNINF